MRVWERLDSLREALLQPINPAVVIFLGGYTILWGLWVLYPFTDVFSTAALYSALADFIPYESFWGMFALVTGAITCYGAFVRSYGTLVRGALFAGLHWFIIGIFYCIGDLANTGGITAITFSFYAAYVYLNIKVNHKYNNLESQPDMFHDKYHHCPECGFNVSEDHIHDA